MRKPPGPKGTPAKKVKKRNPWSDDESKSDSDVENSEPVVPRENKSQRASGIVGVYFIQQTPCLIDFLLVCTTAGQPFHSGWRPFISIHLQHPE